MTDYVAMTLAVVDSRAKEAGLHLASATGKEADKATFGMMTHEKDGTLYAVVSSLVEPGFKKHFKKWKTTGKTSELNARFGMSFEDAVESLGLEEWEGFTPSSKSKAATDLRKEREALVVSMLQIRLTLGQKKWRHLEEAASDTAIPWAMKQGVRHAGEVRRNSATADELSFLLDYDNARMDDLFREAARVPV